jgi:hypothetical protein
LEACRQRKGLRTSDQREDRPESAEDQLRRQAEHARTLMDEVEKRRAQAESENLNFTAPTEEQLIRKLRGDRNPSIYFQSWSGSTSPGGTVAYNRGITNPDPTPWIWLAVHLFIGPANLASDVDEAVSAVNTRFPRLTLPSFDGLQLQPGDSQTLSFSIQVPSGLQPSNYFGTSFLFQSLWHDPTVNLDRSFFVFEVT